MTLSRKNTCSTGMGNADEKRHSDKKIAITIARIRFNILGTSMNTKMGIQSAHSDSDLLHVIL